jgi:hypothetical protein
MYNISKINKIRKLSIFKKGKIFRKKRVRRKLSFFYFLRKKYRCITKSKNFKKKKRIIFINKRMDLNQNKLDFKQKNLKKNTDFNKNKNKFYFNKNKINNKFF